MQTSITATHASETLTISLARLFERASYYGLRALIVLYMISETFTMERSEALYIYGIFTSSIVLSPLLGSILGDLVFGSKRGVIIGGCLQALGAFSLCIPTTTGLYVGIVLTVLGGGFYTPNLIAFFGKQYLTKTKLLDSGFTILYLAVSLGVFLGILSIGFIGEMYGYSYGFALAGVLALLSTLLIVITKEAKLPEQSVFENSIWNRIAKIALAFLFIGIFWALYSVSGYAMSDIQLQVKAQYNDSLPDGLWSSVSSIGIYPISIIAILLWMRSYQNRFLKIAIGFFAAALSFGLLTLIPESIDSTYLVVFFGALILLSIAEVCIAPIIHSMLTKHTHPKYLAMVIALSFIPMRLLVLSTEFLGDTIYDHVKLGLYIGMIAMPIMGIGAVLFYFVFRKVEKA
ncbi:MFS transporter [Dokdonia sp.]|uniref:MFS transporter n=1 Tax=Dokdonia sp. TaxID=2024995 RepID=UPI0032662BC2